MYKKSTLVFVLFSLLQCHVFAQTAVAIHDGINERIFHSDEIELLEDPTGKLTIKDIQDPRYNRSFVFNENYYPKNVNLKSAYWYRIRLNYNLSYPHKTIFEFYDQTTDEITAYIPDSNNNYHKSISGAEFKFDKRLFHHKNFEFTNYTRSKGEQVCYFRIKSSQEVNVIIVYRTIGWFIEYALTEYFSFGIFYGMILLFSFYNLLMFLAFKRKQYLYYVFYILSVGLFEMTTDGIAFQYLWPGQPRWNEFAYGMALFSLSMFALIFTKELLSTKTRAPKINRMLNVVMGARILYFILCLAWNNNLFTYKFVEFIPLSFAFYAGICIWKKGYRPARFFVLGYGFLFVGFVVKVLLVLGYGHFIPGLVAHYSLGFCFIVEMVLLSFAIGDQVRILRTDKERAHKRIIRQMTENAKLKDSINRELELQVQSRTKEIIEKSGELQIKSETIERQNKELILKNAVLQEQAEEISRMNVLLENDNLLLKTNIEKVTEARVFSKELDFNEFSLKYPDRDTCYKLLADIKWDKPYSCVKCGNGTYCNGRVCYNRRCKKCGYEESVLHNTIFENSRIPINKAFYLVYLLYTSKGEISSHKLSEKLEIRQSTCWSYSSKIKKMMEDRKKELKGSGQSGWSKLLIENN